MTIEEASIHLFRTLLANLEGQRLIDNGQPILAGTLFRIPSVARELFDQEPGCAVRYEALEEKINLLEPHLKVTTSGPKLLTFFVELLKQRDEWATAMANYQANIVTVFLMQQQRSDRLTSPVGPTMLASQPIEEGLRDKVHIAEKKLLKTKSGLAFYRYVRILEECAKKYKTHIHRRANAKKTRNKTTMLKKTKTLGKKRPQESTVTTAGIGAVLSCPLQTELCDTFLPSPSLEWAETAQVGTGDASLITTTAPYVSTAPNNTLGNSQHRMFGATTADDSSKSEQLWFDMPTPTPTVEICSEATASDDLSSSMIASQPIDLPNLFSTEHNLNLGTHSSAQSDLDHLLDSIEFDEFTDLSTDVTDFAVNTTAPSTAEHATDRDPIDEDEFESIEDILQPEKPALLCSEPQFPSEWFEFTSENHAFPAFDLNNLDSSCPFNDFGAAFDDELWGGQESC
jgi:hypothetical protein